MEAGRGSGHRRSLLERLAAVLIVGALLHVATAHAQEQPAEPASLATGFTPDPARLPGRTAGRRPLNELAPGCRGYVGQSPDEVVELTTRFGFLRFFVVAPRDVTFAIRGPDGRWRCSGEPLGGAPREEGRFAAGRYEVWIGSTERNLQVPYELQITEFQTVTPLTGNLEEAYPVGGGAELGLEVQAEGGRYRDRRLRRGFLPDPREDGGRAGGEIDVGLLGADCGGFVDPRPSHVLTLRNDFDYFRVQLGDAAGTTTLVVRTPGGRYLCSSPGEELNPHVDQDAWPEGEYRIWVGAREEASAPRYRICYTEVRPVAGSVACGSERRRRAGDRRRTTAPSSEPQDAGVEAPDAGETPAPDGASPEDASPEDAADDSAAGDATRDDATGE